MIDLRTVPHWLNAGATQSGKSNWANAVIKSLAPQPVALVGFDLKGGVEFTPYAPRLSALATNRKESVDLLSDLVGEVENRMALCRAHGARNVWTLPEALRPVPVVVLVDADRAISDVLNALVQADQKPDGDDDDGPAGSLVPVAKLHGGSLRPLQRSRPGSGFIS
ncbi:FtsK/SpoIIIE domain-containing protein [Actinomadura miaoliensis]|uniref:FtsK domain-containing protein n=1 Tax=Actinomadura miaoliensis TaxID=430685 RepID=A0ABP7W1F9_9ACTN